MLRVRSCGLSDVGLTRVHNEDYFEIDPLHRLYVVADGMGGHSYGEVAAQIAVKAIHDYVETSRDREPAWRERPSNPSAPTVALGTPAISAPSAAAATMTWWGPAATRRARPTSTANCT